MFDSTFKLLFRQLIDKLKLFKIKLSFLDDFFEDVLFFLDILRSDFRFLSFNLDIVKLILFLDSFDSVLSKVIKPFIEFLYLNLLKINLRKINCVFIIF